MTGRPRGRPKKDDSVPTVMLDIDIPFRLKREAENIAADNKISLTDFVTVTLKANLKCNSGSFRVVPLIGDWNDTARLQVKIPKTLRKDLDDYADRFGIESVFIARQFINYAVANLMEK